MSLKPLTLAAVSIALSFTTTFAGAASILEHNPPSERTSRAITVEHSPPSELADRGIIDPNFRTTTADRTFHFRGIVDPNVRCIVDPNFRSAIDPNIRCIIDPNNKPGAH